MRISKVSLAALVGVSLFASSTVVAPAFAEAPKAVKIVAPEYPRGAERRKIEGFVVIKFDINADGSTTNPTVVEAQPAGVFDAAAIKAVGNWQFESSSAGAMAEKKKLRFEL